MGAVVQSGDCAAVRLRVRCAVVERMRSCVCLRARRGELGSCAGGVGKLEEDDVARNSCQFEVSDATRCSEGLLEVVKLSASRQR
jgi:hypothetical protein